MKRAKYTFWQLLIVICVVWLLAYLFLPPVAKVRPAKKPAAAISN
jgi:hypothetical protein